MVQILAYLFMFLLGAIVGAGSFMAYGLHQVRKLKKAKQSILDDLKRRTEETDQKEKSIKERLTKAAQIAKFQMELRAQVEMPSKNGLHSKYKNDLALEIQDMEQEKLDILRTILADGYNPIITVIQDGVKEDIPLSEYITTAQQVSDDIPIKPESDKSTSDDSSKPRKAGKFFVYKGGKDDGTVH